MSGLRQELLLRVRILLLHSLMGLGHIFLDISTLFIRASRRCCELASKLDDGVHAHRGGR